MDTIQSQHAGSGRELASSTWLKSHHEAKKDFRRKVVRAFGLSDGDTVVDLGCGPGFWTPMIIEMIGDAGHYHGFDVAIDLIEQAKDNYGALLDQGQVTFEVRNITDLHSVISECNVVLVMNVLGYLRDPMSAIRRIWRQLAPGTRLIVRQFDNGASIFSPVVDDLQHRIYAGAFSGIEQRDPELGNPILGRQLAKLFQLAEIPIHTSQVDGVLIEAPLSPYERSYLGAKADWFANLANGSVSSVDLDAWRRELPPSGYGGSFESRSFTFATVEFQIEAVKHD